MYKCLILLILLSACAVKSGSTVIRKSDLAGYSPVYAKASTKKTVA